MKKKLIALLLTGLFLFSACAAAGATEPQYAEPKVINASIESWQGFGAYDSDPNIPLYIKLNYQNGNNDSGNWSMIYRDSEGKAGIIVEVYNAAPWLIGEMVRNLTYGGPDGCEPISINGIPWQIFTSPGVYDDRPEYDDLKGAAGRIDMAGKIKNYMLNSEDPYSNSRATLPIGDKKMVSVYNDQNIAVVYTSTTATCKALLSRPYTANSLMMVPLRGIIDYLGADINWDAASSSIIIKKDSKEVKLKVGSKTADVNGTSVQMDMAPDIVNGYTMVPLRFLSEQLGYNVKWIGSINSNVHRADISN